MQVDFHFYVIHALAQEAMYGDDGAGVIAYASQYVDDNIDRQYIAADEFGQFTADFPKRIDGAGELKFPIITQGETVSCLDLHVQRYAYAPFHFIPGDNNVAMNGQKNPLCTTAGCQRAVDLIGITKKQADLYKLGIALHTYADTWSHARFSAFHEDWNRVYNNFIGNLPPNIGHAEVYNKPDEISTVWKDARFGETIDNYARALQAAEVIFNSMNTGKTQWKDIKGKFEEIMGAHDLKTRIQLVREKYSIAREYDEDRWIREALRFSRNPGEVPDQSSVPGAPLPRPRFVNVAVKDPNAHWFKFQNAAKAQLSWVLNSVKIL